MRNILEAPFIRDIGAIYKKMYRLGWNERNGGNISMRLDESEIEDYLDLACVKWDIPLSHAFPGMVGKYFVVTGTQKYFKNIKYIVNCKIINTIDDESLRTVCKDFNITVKEGWL